MLCYVLLFIVYEVLFVVCCFCLFACIVFFNPELTPFIDASLGATLLDTSNLLFIVLLCIVYCVFSLLYILYLYLFLLIIVLFIVYCIHLNLRKEGSNQVLNIYIPYIPYIHTYKQTNKQTNKHIYIHAYVHIYTQVNNEPIYNIFL